ncbi:MAG: hypothetical protein AAF648_02710 [Pseudomonadota bacterium]
MNRAEPTPEDRTETDATGEAETFIEKFQFEPLAADKLDVMLGEAVTERITVRCQDGGEINQQLRLAEEKVAQALRTSGEEQRRLIALAQGHLRAASVAQSPDCREGLATSFHKKPSDTANPVIGKIY